MSIGIFGASAIFLTPACASEASAGEFGSIITTTSLAISVAVQEIEYIVKNSAKWREKISILSKVSGSIHPKNFTALVSASPLTPSHTPACHPVTLTL